MSEYMAIPRHRTWHTRRLRRSTRRRSQAKRGPAFRQNRHLPAPQFARFFARAFYRQSPSFENKLHRPEIERYALELLDQDLLAVLLDKELKLVGRLSVLVQPDVIIGNGFVGSDTM